MSLISDLRRLGFKIHPDRMSISQREKAHIALMNYYLKNPQLLKPSKVIQTKKVYYSNYEYVPPGKYFGKRNLKAA